MGNGGYTGGSSKVFLGSDGTTWDSGDPKPDEPSGAVRKRWGDYAVRRANAQRASDVLPTQHEAIERARELSPGSRPHVERVRETSGGSPDKWRKA